MNALYTAIAEAHGGRKGQVKTQDGSLELSLAMPKELGGNGQGNNPEQLFAAGYAACFESALRYVAQAQKLDLKDASVIAQVSLYPTPEQGFKLGVTLQATLKGLEQNQAEMLVNKAHEVCPYSNAIKNNVEVSISAYTN